jgi:hypothetical protein
LELDVFAKNIAKENNLDITHIRVKNKQLTFVDKDDQFFISDKVMSLLKLVVEKYPDLDTELLVSPWDFPPELLYNFPVFCVANMPSQNIYNPVIYHDCVSTMFENIANTQSKFSEKKTMVFGRYGISGLQGINIDNWTSYYKTQFALATLMCPELIDIKFLLVPHDFKLWEGLINNTFDPNVRDFLLSMPVYDTGITNIWLQTIYETFNHKVCIFNEGNSNASIPRILNVIHNDGVVLKIGKSKHQSIMDIMLNSIDEKIVYSQHERPDNKFYNSIENSLSDENYRRNKNRLAKEYFNLNNIIDLTYETLKLYSVMVRK